MIGDVAEMRLHRRVNRQHIGVLQPLAYIQQRRRRVAQSQEFAAQHIEPVNGGVLEVFLKMLSSIASTSLLISSSTGA